MSSYRELKVWQRSVELGVKIIKLADGFPKNFKFSLCNQIERSAISVASNIAEGSGRNTTKEYIQFLGYAHGSLLELETQIFICSKLNLIPDYTEKEIISEAGEIGKMLKGLQKVLKAKIEKKPDTVTDTVN